MTKSKLNTMLMVVAGVMVAGYVMHMGRNLPVIGDAQLGYSG